MNSLLVRNADRFVQELFHVSQAFCSMVLRFGASNEVFDGDSESRGDPDGLRSLREDFPGAPVPESLIFNVSRFSKRFLRHFSFFYQRVNTVPKTCRHITRINDFLLKINIILLDKCSYMTILDIRYAVE